MLSIFRACEPRTEVLSGELREEIFAARLRDVIEGQADAVYQDPTIFFDNTYPTEGLVTLLGEALGRLSGAKPANNAIIRLETAFGGGKTHNLIALYHAASGHIPPANFLDPQLVPPPGAVRIAGVVGSDLDPTMGLQHGHVTTYTLWGEIAYQLGGAQAYEYVRRSEIDRTAPGTGLLEELIGDQPTLIMLDEVARHLRAAKTVPTATGRSDLAEQTVAFLMSLFEFAASKKQAVIVLTLADESDAFGRETEELRQEIARELAETRRLSARQELVITPTVETEIAAIVTHRLFRHIDRAAAAHTARAYMDYYRQCVAHNANLPQRALRAEYALEIEANYPFHPDLLTALNRKVSTIPNFQKTRGALRLLAMVVRQLWNYPQDGVYLIHPFNVDLGHEGIANDLTGRLERPRFKQIIEADIVSHLAGSQAHAQILDEAIGGVPFTQRVATTAFIHSLTQGVASGIDPADLTLAVLTPDDDPALIQRAADRLLDKGWYFEYDGHRYRFKPEVSLNKIIEDEMGAVGLVTAKMELDQRIRQVWKKGFLKPVFFPSEPADVDDDAGAPKLVIVHYDAAVTATQSTTPPDLVVHLFNHTGVQEGYRIFKNNLVFLVADSDQVENMVAHAQRYLAIRRILNDNERLNDFYEDQRQKLKRMGDAAELDVRVAITKAYRWLYYPSGDAPQTHSNLAREQLQPQDQGKVNVDQSEVVLHILKTLEKVQTQDSPSLSAKFVRSKAWDAGKNHLSTEDLRQAFARKMNLRMLLDVNQLKKTIRNGVEQGVWIYYDAREQVGYDAESPFPVIQINDETFLYDPDEYKRLGWPIRGKEPAPPPDERCPICGNLVTECTCGRLSTTLPRQLKGEGVPRQAFQRIYDLCTDQGITRLHTLTIDIQGTHQQGANEVRALGLAIPQLGKGNFRVEQNLTVEFDGGEYFQIRFKGGWDRYKRLKQVTDAFAQEGRKLNVVMTLRADLPDGLEVQGDQFRTMYEVFDQLGFGSIVVTADPFDEDARP
ncbi:MAG: ATP-binding protein [Anaerolineae bacterium]|nr:ATP-binding protein [Anaerolineae bacterium]